ncbi:MAG TPA: lipase maturation factor family protein, partial [Bdellovibrionota bacterium]|nr:lipase maturation factor family protein [Bdellovibrionota bacterium]
VALCLLLLDDAAWLRSWRVRAFYLQPEEQSYPPRRWPKWVLTPIAVILLTLSSVQLLNMFRVVRRWPRPVVQLFQTTEPFHLVSGYGLFAVMTTSRPEIIVEGSEDGQEWKSYEFKFKPGDPTRKPSFVAPHQPRLDWQMWFAALGSCETNPWFLHFARRLMEGSKDVASLLAVNPFPDDPPNYIRTTVYDYRFTRRNSNDHGDSWWRREELREYCPILTLGKRGTRA